MLVTKLFFALATVATSLPTQNVSEEYEYIVIGSGPGGGPLAANLARAGHSVLLLEAGGDNGDNTIERIPSFAQRSSENPNSTWAFWVSHFQNETQARRDNKFTYRTNNGSFYVGLDPPEDAEPLGIFYPRGATVGGSGQSNAMNFAMPADDEWIRIAEATGDDDWLPENLVEHLIDIENNHYLPEGTEGHGFDGYLSSIRNNITYVIDRDGVSDVVVETTRLLEGKVIESREGLIEILERDPNSLDPARYQQQGIRQTVVNVNEDRERSGARGYVIDTLNVSRNGSQAYPLTLSTHSLATRILFSNDEEIPRAYGVEYIEGEALYAGDRRYDESETGTLRQARATREVIVAGGSFNTPQILKLSGVGPREELEEHGIDVVVDNRAVGNYMCDNYEGGVSVRANTSWPNPPLAGCSIMTPENDTCRREWEQGYGPYGQAAAPLSMWFRSSVSENEDSDIWAFGNAGVEFRGYWPGYSNNPVPQSTFFWSIVKMQPNNSAGTVRLRSSDPRDTPIIDFNFFEEDGDRELQALTEAAEFTIQVFNNLGEPYAPYEIVEPVPGVEIRQSIKDHTFSHHVTSTCRMGPTDNLDYCVDSKFRVNGVQGLRVVDASVFPRTPGAFPVGPTYLISQKAFRDIVSAASE